MGIVIVRASAEQDCGRRVIKGKRGENTHPSDFESMAMRKKLRVHWETQYRKVVEEPSCIRKPDTGQQGFQFCIGSPNTVHAHVLGLHTVRKHPLLTRFKFFVLGPDTRPKASPAEAAICLGGNCLVQTLLPFNVATLYIFLIYVYINALRTS